MEGAREGNQTHSEPRRSDGGGQESSQTHSVPGGVVEGTGGVPSTLSSREKWWWGPGRQPKTLISGRSGGGRR